VAIAQIPLTGLHRVLEASPEECQRLAAAAGIPSVSDVRAEFTLLPGRADSVRLDGRVTAQVAQTCVVSLEPMESTIDEVVELTFAPAEQVARLSALADDTDDEAERPDPPEPIENDFIDLGRVATDALFLGIDPYPRRPDAVLELPAEVADPADHPFAALKALKEDGGSSKG
jgi:uncharacterized metal-binding protein YceD (DUF177 family)